jgi:outer membrane protein assembly factor BamB
MNRRTRRSLLATLSGGFAALAGCTGPPSSGDGPDTSTPSPSSRGSPTPTTGEDGAPRVVDLDEDATRWAVEFDGPVTERPTFAEGTVVVGTSYQEFGTPEPGSDLTWSLSALAAGDGTPEWTLALDAPAFDRPVVEDGAVYVQTGFTTGYTGTGQRLVKAVDGERRWRTDGATGFNSLLAVDDTGRAFVGTSDDAIGTSDQPQFAVEDDGSTAWTVESGDAFGGRLLNDGLLVDVGGVVLERRATDDGSQTWRVEAEVLTEADGTIPVVDDAAFVSRNADDGDRFAAVDLADGRVEWTFDDAGEAPFVPTGGTVVPGVTTGTGHDGLVVGTAYDGEVFGLAPLDGGVVWRFETEGDVRDGPVSVGERVYVGDFASTVYAVDATDGSEVWRTDAGGPVGSLGVAGDTLVVRSGNGSDRLLGLDRAGGTVRWTFEADGNLTRPALGDGVVAVGSERGIVRLLGPAP